MSERDVRPREAIAILLRALRYLYPVRRAFAVKILLTLASLLPALLVLPWIGKLLVDQVIQGIPFEKSPTPYPFFLMPLLEPLRGASPETLALWIGIAISLVLVLVGAWWGGTDQTIALSSEGLDSATRSENQANYAWSYAGGLLGIIDYRYTLKISQAVNHRLRSQLFGRLSRLPMTKLDDQRIGDAVYRVMYDTPSISEVCYRCGLTPFVTPFRILIAIWVMWLTFGNEPLVIWAGILVLPLVLAVTIPFGGVIRRLGITARSSGAKTTVAIEEGTANVLAVQSLGGQARESARFDAESTQSYADFRKLAVVWIGMVALGTVCVGLLGLSVFYRLTDRLFAGAITTGDMVVLFTYYYRIAQASVIFGQVWISLQENISGLRRAFELLDEPIDAEPEQPSGRERIEQGVELDHVTVRYPDGTQALTDVSLHMKRGSLVALVGPAGAGKTTLAYLVPRFLSPSEGRVLVDGVDAQQWSPVVLRKNAAFVFQEPVLIDATLADNVRVGKPDASHAEITRALELAGAGELIARLPQGLDTPLGRGGGRLSVGQKQRVSIARALVADTPVLVLDEPTAALDPVTEAKLVETLEQVRRDKLVIVIAHRLSTIRHADHIVFLSSGRVLEQGSHQALLARPDGAYRRFVELQAGSAPAKVSASA